MALIAVYAELALEGATGLQSDRLRDDDTNMLVRNQPVTLQVPPCTVMYDMCFSCI